MIYTSNYKSPLGNITIASEEENIIGLWFENQKYYLSSIKEKTIDNDDDKAIIKAKKWLDKYFNNEYPSIKELPLNLKGTEFQLLVWNILKEIPYGETMSYKEIADRIAKSKKLKGMSAQAVGGAVGHNPISIIVPCHRVVGSHGNLTGYAGGLDKKIYLLKHENVDVTKYYIKEKGNLIE